MAYTTFDALYNAAVGHYQRGEFAAAYEVLTREGRAFPDHAGMVYYLRSCFAARDGHQELALRLLDEALGRGIWYGERLLRHSPSWAPLQGAPEFERLAAISLERMAAAEARPLLLTQAPAGSPPELGWPLLLALHGNGDNAARTLAGWGPSAGGWLLAAPQSSQPMMSGSFIWDDQDLARAEVLRHYQDLYATQPVNPAHVVLAGFSMGGETALRLALEGAVAARGVVLLGPGGPTMDDPTRWVPLIEQARERHLRGAIILGADDDPALVAGGETLAALLVERGVPCMLELIPGLAHDYPPDGGAALRRALEFVG